MQAEVLMGAFHEAGLPLGVIVIVTGLGEVVGTELTSKSRHSENRFPDRLDAESENWSSKTPWTKMKALDAEKSRGKVAQRIILDDADLSTKRFRWPINATAT